jgi:hypothetical protein
VPTRFPATSVYQLEPGSGAARRTHIFGRAKLNLQTLVVISQTILIIIEVPNVNDCGTHFDDAFARFLPHEPNIRTLKRGREGM